MVAFAGCEVWGWLLRLLWPGGGHDALWPALITQLPFLCALGYLTGKADTTVERVFGLGKVRLGAVLTSALLLYLLETVARVATVVTLSSLGVGMGTGVNPEAERKAASSFFAVTDNTVWAPICEELACRGLLYTTLRIRLGIVTSSVLTAAVFSGMHYPASVMEAAFRFCPAVVSSLWYERTRSLWPNVITHAVYNLLATVRWWV